MRGRRGGGREGLRQYFSIESQREGSSKLVDKTICMASLSLIAGPAGEILRNAASRESCRILQHCSRYNKGPSGEIAV